MNKPIFTNEEAENFVIKVVLPFFKMEEITNSLKNNIIRLMEQAEYIKKSDLEIVREEYESLNNSCDIEYYKEICHRMVNLQQKEIERLNF